MIPSPARAPLLHLLLFLLPIAAQPTPSPSDNSIASFQPSLAVIIGMLSIMFSLTFILLVYAKFCHRAPTAVHHIHDSLIRSRRTTSGLDRSLLDSLPFFPFSSLHGSRHGLECSVCLAKFHDADVLRLLPKCKHAFHLECIDQWLCKHSTCPLCRHRVSQDDVASSMRFMSSRNELYVCRQESSRFSNGSFRKVEDEDEDEEEGLPIINETKEEKSLHKFKHRIVISDVVFKHRWSNVTSADLLVLNSEMVNYVSSERFSSLSMKKTMDEEEEEEEIVESEGDTVMGDIKKEMERKILFENRVREIAQFRGGDVDQDRIIGKGSKGGVVSQNDKRSVSEIIVHPRFMESRINCGDSTTVKEERRRRIWLPIARKTVQWFANREKTSRSSTTTIHTPNV